MLSAENSMNLISVKLWSSLLYVVLTFMHSLSLWPLHATMVTWSEIQDLFTWDWEQNGIWVHLGIWNSVSHTGFTFFFFIIFRLRNVHCFTLKCRTYVGFECFNALDTSKGDSCCEILCFSWYSKILIFPCLFRFSLSFFYSLIVMFLNFLLSLLIWCHV